MTYWKSHAAPSAPFYAVIFISKKSDDPEGYQEMDDRMMHESQLQEGFLGYSSASAHEGGIFISYWRDMESIEKWRKHDGHRQAKSNAHRWYNYYHSMISKVESSIVFEKK